MAIETPREECKAGMRHHGGHVWVRANVWLNDVMAGDVIVMEADIKCLDCGIVRAVVIKSRPIAEMVYSEDAGEFGAFE